MKEQNTGEADALIDVLDGWNHNDAKAVLDAVHQASHGNITKADMLAKLADAAGVGAFEETLLEEAGETDDNDEPIVMKDGKRFIQFYIAMSNNCTYDAARDRDVAIDNLGGQYRVVKVTGWMRPPGDISETLDLDIADDPTAHDTTIG